MCEGSFLPSSFGPHQKHTEFESSLRSYPINPFRVLCERVGAPPQRLFSREGTTSVVPKNGLLQLVIPRAFRPEESAFAYWASSGTFLINKKTPLLRAGPVS